MKEKNRVVRMETSKGTMTLELYAARAPKTVERFMVAVNTSKYDGLKFHRIIKDFMVHVKFEGSDVKHVPGVISMAAQQAHVDQSDMQFFIMTSTSDQLDGSYTAFGHVSEGMDVLAAIAATPVAQAPWGERSHPVEDVRIVKASEILD